MIYLEKPKDFESRFEVVSCFVEMHGEILLLLRNPDKPQPNTWGVPAGKCAHGEIPSTAIVREIFEETGMYLTSEPLFMHKVFVRYPDFDFVYYIFRVILIERFAVRINPEEHTDFVWVTPQLALKMPLILDEDECIKLSYGIS